jgi:transcriptional regulator with XRE-family HTH domain
MTQERVIQRFGEKLHALRIQRGLTLKELARQLGHVAHGYISELESGKKLPSIELVLRIARLFEITTDELLKDELELSKKHTGMVEEEQQTEQAPQRRES